MKLDQPRTLIIRKIKYHIILARTTYNRQMRWRVTIQKILVFSKRYIHSKNYPSMIVYTKWTNHPMTSSQNTAQFSTIVIWKIPRISWSSVLLENISVNLRATRRDSDLCLPVFRFFVVA